MKTTDDSFPLVLPAALLSDAEAASDGEHRPITDILRGLVEQGLSEPSWQVEIGKEVESVRKLGLPDDDQSVSDEYRQTIREKIAQGVRSLRDSHVTDGEAFMAQLDTELADLERQGR